LVGVGVGVLVGPGVGVGVRVGVGVLVTTGGGLAAGLVAGGEARATWVWPLSGAMAEVC